MKRKLAILLTVFIFLVNLSCNAIFSFVLNPGSNVKSVACIFAGRKKYLSVLMPYLNYLKDKGKLTEIHFWQFTNNKSDIEYLDSISNLHRTSKKFTKYRVIKPVIKNNCIDLKIKSKSDACILINDRYEIVLGGEDNTKSVIRDGICGEFLTEANLEVLDENSFKNFSVEIKDSVLRVKADRYIMGIKIDDSEIKSIKIHSGNDSDGLWDYEESQNSNIKLFDTNERVGCFNWGEAYKYYLDYDFDIFLKIDDDIVYMDVERYDEFLEYILNNPYVNCVFPNMVNHSVSLYYNNKSGLIPSKILSEEYSNKKSPDDLYFYHVDGEEATKIHEYFLNNVSKFINNNMKPVNLDNHKESICMFGILKKNYDKIFDPELRDKVIKSFYNCPFKTSLEKFDDEVYVYNQKGNVLYPRFVVMHYQFGPQIQSGLSEKFLYDYKNLSKKLRR